MTAVPASVALPRRKSFARTRGAAGSIGSVALTLLGLLALTFFIGRVLPLDPVIAVIGDQADQATYQKVFHELGLDRPLYEQFAIYVGDVMQGNFRQALFTGNAVVDDLKRVLPATVELATAAIIVGVLLGIPLGVLAAVYQGRWIDHVVRVVSLVGHSVPIFWIGMMGLVVFYAKLHLVGGSGRVDVLFLGQVEERTGFLLIDSLLAGDYEVFRDALNHLVLPASILGYSSTASIARLTRSFMLTELNQEYVMAARAKGLKPWRVIWHHAFPNIGVPLLTIVALSYASLLEGAVLTETVFSWPGFGQYLTSSLLIGDMNAVMACTLIVGLIFICVNLICDLLYRVLDPRTR